MPHNPEHFSQPLSERDPLVAGALADELRRQQDHVELIASENIVSRAVLDALGHPMTNKTLEGYPGHRFHGGGEYVDVVEQAAIDRACQLFDCACANVQPHSGTQANQAVFFALLAPGAKILSMNLAAGGHLSHGAKPNQSGRWFDASHYGVDPDTGLIDYDAVEQLALETEPDLVIAGGSAYPRVIDFTRLRRIADAVDARLLVDMAHFAGLVAGGAHPSPLPQADIVTCTTTKTLRGPRGGLILARDPDWDRILQSAIFPGVQGSLHSQVIAAKAVCLGEALRADFRDYAQQVVANARRLGEVLVAHGISLVTGGTDTHMLLLDLRAQELRGQQAQDALARVGITSNKNPIPADTAKPSQWSGLRLGVAAATTRGFGAAEIDLLGEVIALAIQQAEDADTKTLDAARQRVAGLCERFPLYP